MECLNLAKGAVTLPGPSQLSHQGVVYQVSTHRRELSALGFMLRRILCHYLGIGQNWVPKQLDA